MIQPGGCFRITVKLHTIESASALSDPSGPLGAKPEQCNFRRPPGYSDGSLVLTVTALKGTAESSEVPTRAGVAAAAGGQDKAQDLAFLRSSQVTPIVGTPTWTWMMALLQSTACCMHF